MGTPTTYPIPGETPADRRVENPGRHGVPNHLSKHLDCSIRSQSMVQTRGTSPILSSSTTRTTLGSFPRGQRGYLEQTAISRILTGASPSVTGALRVPMPRGIILARINSIEKSNMRGARLLPSRVEMCKWMVLRAAGPLPLTLRVFALVRASRMSDTRPDDV